MTDCARSPTNTHRCPCYHAGLWHSTTAERCPCRLDHANDNATSMPDSPFNHSLAHSLTRYVCLCCTPQRHATQRNARQTGCLRHARHRARARHIYINASSSRSPAAVGVTHTDETALTVHHQRCTTIHLCTIQTTQNRNKLLR